MQNRTEYRVALLDMPRAQPAALLGLADIFSLPARLAAPSAFTCHTVPPTVAQKADVVILPPTTGAPPTHDPVRTAYLQTAHAEGALLVGICAGAFALAETGLLDGGHATTHATLRAPFAEHYPKIALAPGAAPVWHGRLLTVSGVLGWSEAALEVLGRLGGVLLAKEVSAHLRGAPRPEDAAVARALRLIDRSASLPLRISDLAEVAGLSPRTLHRRFVKAVGHSPAAALRKARIARAMTLLRESGQSIAEIGWSVGYHDPAAFSRAFRDETGQTPGSYRRTLPKRP